MGKKRLYVVGTILVAAGIGVCVLTLTLRVSSRAQENRESTSMKEANPAGNEAQADSQENRTQAQAREPLVAVPAAGGSEETVMDEPFVPLPEHNPMAVRIALEKAKRPDLKNKPSGPERIKAHHKTLQIPEEELATLPTDRLLEKVVSTPMVVHMMLEPYPDGGLRAFARTFNGVEAFLNRPDAAEVLRREYGRLSDVIAAARTPDPFYAKTEQLMAASAREPLLQHVREAPWEKRPFSFTVMEVLMTSEQVMSQWKDANQRTQAVSSILKSLDARERFDSIQPHPVYGKPVREYSAVALAKYLEVLRVPEYSRWYAPKQAEGLFVDRSVTPAESEEIISMARAHIGQPSSTQAAH